MSENQSVAKKILLEFLDFLAFKVKNDLMTCEDMESISKSIGKGLDLQGTADDFSRFYGKPKTNVSSVINRRMIKKPVRRVYYSFNAFRKIIPSSWKIHK